MDDDFIKWLHDARHASLAMAWEAGGDNVKAKIIRMIQQCVDRDATLAKLAEAVEEL